MRSIQPAAFSSDPDFGHMVRSFSIQKGWPSRPTRRCAITGERLDSAAIVNAEVASTGVANANRAAPAARSAISVSHEVWRGNSQNRGLSMGSRLMVDTAGTAANVRSCNEYTRRSIAGQGFYILFAFLLPGSG